MDDEVERLRIENRTQRTGHEVNVRALLAEIERLREGLDMIAHWRDDLQTADAARMRTIARSVLDG